MAVVISGCFSWPEGAEAQSDRPSPPDGSDPQLGQTSTVESGSSFTLFPEGEVFPVYVADPTRPTNAILFPYYTKSEIPGVSGRRTRLSAGGRFGMARFDIGGPDGWSWQASFEAGFDALFDSQNSNESIGWDGNYGVTVTTASHGPWAYKIGFLHTSAHVGDEYDNHQNRRRLDYTREEMAFGVAWRAAPRWRVYGEVGRAYELLNALQAPWRLQQGLEYEAAPGLLGGRFAWYGSADFQAMQERGWRIDRALQGGIVMHSSGRAYRLGLEYYDGRPTVADFFAYSEASITWGLRIDL
jgi:hypothetical protein